MKDVVYRLVPIYGANIAELFRLATWLEKKAQKGYFFTSFCGMVRFRKGEPATVKYLVLPNRHWVPNQTQCESLGFKLLDRGRMNVYIAKSQEAQAPQIDQLPMRKALKKTLLLLWSGLLCMMTLFFLTCTAQDYQVLEKVLLLPLIGSMLLFFIQQIILLISFLKRQIIYDCLPVRIVISILICLGLVLLLPHTIIY